MTELELMANEEARHGNREALERMEAELREARMTELSALGQAQEAYEAQQRLEAENARLKSQIDLLKMNTDAARF